MEQLSAICHVDTARQILPGFSDVTLDEFWVRGHMPKAPLMPGVIICEVAAELASYFVQKYDLLGAVKSSDSADLKKLNSAAECCQAIAL